MRDWIIAITAATIIVTAINLILGPDHIVKHLLALLAVLYLILTLVHKWRTHER